MSRAAAFLLLIATALGGGVDDRIKAITSGFPTFHETLMRNPSVQQDTAKVLASVKQRKEEIIAKHAKKIQDRSPDVGKFPSIVSFCM